MKREQNECVIEKPLKINKTIKEAVDFVDDEVKKTFTDIISPFRDFLENRPDEF